MRRQSAPTKAITEQYAASTAVNRFMHDGVFLNLEDVIEFLDRGGGANTNLSPLMRPLGLTQEEKADLLAFLETLTGAPLKIEPLHLPH
jgi:cytochrome c peroxidase